MQILLISLKRLGDMVPVLQAAAELKRNGAHVSLLCFREFESLANASLDVDKVVTIDRKLIGLYFSENFFNPVTALKVLERDLKTIRDVKFDQVINMTHDRLSGFLCSWIKSENVKGVSFRNNILSMNSLSSIYLNDVFTSETLTPLSQSYLMFRTAGVSGRSKISLKINDPDRRYCEGVMRRARSKNPQVVGIIFSTSESKKNIPNTFTRQIIKELQQNNFTSVLIGTSQDRSNMLAIAEGFSDVEVVVSNIPQLNYIINDVDVVVSPDTLGAHLAAAAQKPLAMISLGSSNPWKQPPWTSRALIFHSNVSCAPCGHRSSCTQSSHLCSESMDAGRVASGFIHWLKTGSESNGSYVGHMREIGKSFIFEFRGVHEGINKELMAESAILQVAFYLDDSNKYPSFDLNFYQTCDDALSSLPRLPQKTLHGCEELVTLCKSLKDTLLHKLKSGVFPKSDLEQVLKTVKAFVVVSIEQRRMVSVTKLLASSIWYHLTHETEMSDLIAKWLKTINCIQLGAESVLNEQRGYRENDVIS